MYTLKTNERGWAVHILAYQTHLEVHEDRVVLSGVLLGSGYRLPGNGPVGKAHQNLEHKQSPFN